MRRLRCKGEKEEGHHEDGYRIYLRGDVVINGVEGFEEGVAPIDPYSTSISKGGGLSEDSGEGSTTELTRYCGNHATSCYQTGLTYWARASFYRRWSWSLGREELGPPLSYSWTPVAQDAPRWWTTTVWRCPTSTGRSYTPRGGGEQAK